MKSFEMNIFHFILLVIFIYVFTYYWLPKVDIIKTPEYKKLFANYSSAIEERDYWSNMYQMSRSNQQNNVHDRENNDNIVIGSQSSAHGSAINPRPINSNDNYAVGQLLF